MYKSEYIFTCLFKWSLPEIYPLGKMLLVAWRHQLLYIKNEEKRKKKENVFKKFIYFLLLLLFYFFKLCSQPIFSLGPSIKIAAASFLSGLCEREQTLPGKEETEVQEAHTSPTVPLPSRPPGSDTLTPTTNLLPL